MSAIYRQVPAAHRPPLMLARSSQSRTSAPATVTAAGRPDRSMLYNTGASESLCVQSTPPARTIPLASGTARKNCARPTCSQPLCGCAGALAHADAPAALARAATNHQPLTANLLADVFFNALLPDLGAID